MKFIKIPVNDDWFNGLPPKQKMMFIYFLLNAHKGRYDDVDNGKLVLDIKELCKFAGAGEAHGYRMIERGEREERLRRISYKGKRGIIIEEFGKFYGGGENEERERREQGESEERTRREIKDDSVEIIEEISPKSKEIRDKSKDIVVTKVTMSFSPEDLFNFWNEKLPNKKAHRLTPGRRKKLLTRLKDFPDKSDWEEILGKAEHNDWLLGSSWFNFDWVMKSLENLTKLKEGNYDQSSQGSVTGQKFNPAKKHEEPPLTEQEKQIVHGQLGLDFNNLPDAEDLWFKVFCMDSREDRLKVGVGILIVALIQKCRQDPVKASRIALRLQPSMLPLFEDERGWDEFCLTIWRDDFWLGYVVKETLFSAEVKGRQAFLQMCDDFNLTRLLPSQTERMTYLGA